MTTSHITLAQVGSAVQAAVARFDDKHRNPGLDDDDSCSYTNIDGEHCIAGEAGVILGLEVPGLMDEDNLQPVDQCDVFVYSLTDEALAYLALVQRHADSGRTWARSVTLADAGVRI